MHRQCIVHTLHKLQKESEICKSLGVSPLLSEVEISVSGPYCMLSY